MPIIDEEPTQIQLSISMYLEVTMSLSITDIRDIYMIKHRDNEFALGHNHINGIENFGDKVKYDWQSSD